MEKENTPIVENMRIICTEYAGTCDAAFKFTPLSPAGDAPYEDCTAEFRFPGFSAIMLFTCGTRSVHNLLECRISLDEGDDRIDFSLYDLLYLLDENDFHCYHFYHISSAAVMERCLTVILSAITKYRDQLSAIGSNKEIADRAKARKAREISAITHRDILSSGARSGDPLFEWQMRYYRDIYIGRLCSAWYTDYVHGRYERAAKKLSSFAAKSAYEQRLCRFITTLVSGASYEVIPPECDIFSERRPMSSAIRALPAYIATALIALPISAAAYTALGYAVYDMLYSGRMATPFIRPGMIGILAFVSVFSALFAARVFYRKLTGRKTREKMNIIGGVACQKKDERTARRLFRFAAVILIIITVFSAKNAYVLESGTLTDNTGLSKKSYSTDSIEEIIPVKVPDTIGGTGYAIKFTNGTSAITAGYDLSQIAQSISENSK